MSTHKYFDRICCAVLALALVITVVFMNSKKFGVVSADNGFGYESRLFDTSRVHTINIVMDDWESFISTCTSEEYSVCSVIVDNEAYKNVAIRAKGNTSLSNVQSYGNDRYSFKIEFDHYDNTTTYYGLDKLSLNNIIQDNTYMKDYLCYQMMKYAGAVTPLCSYVQVLVNGEEWGLYLAIEGIEDTFLQRNYGTDYGNLYKPDSMSMGGGIGNGGKFNMDDWREQNEQGDTDNRQEMPFNKDDMPSRGDFSGEFEKDKMPSTENLPEDFDKGSFGNFGGMSFGKSNDVSLVYSDDNYDSYSNIFDNAKTDITNADKDRLIASLKQMNENTNIETVVDTEAVIRYFVAHNFTCNFDSYTGSMIHNYYLYEKDGQLSMLPWDYNLAFGGFVGGNDATNLVNYPIDSPVSGGNVESRPMLSWIFESEEYTSLYHEYFSQFINDYFTSGAFSREFKAVKDMISPFVESDPTKFCTYEEFLTGTEMLEQFCLLRAESIKGQLDGTIPATSDAQSQDNSALIDASEISVSSMGSMGGGNPGDMRPNKTEGDSQANAEENTPNTQNPETPSNPNDDTENMQPPQFPSGEMPSIPDGWQGGEMPQMPNGEMPTPPNGFNPSFGSGDMQFNRDDFSRENI